MLTYVVLGPLGDGAYSVAFQNHSHSAFILSALVLPDLLSAQDECERLQSRAASQPKTGPFSSRIHRIRG